MTLISGVEFQIAADIMGADDVEKDFTYVGASTRVAEIVYHSSSVYPTFYVHDVFIYDGTNRVIDIDRSVDTTP